MGVYETTLAEDSTDAEAYWALVLCKFGIEYVDDPASGRKIPTCNRTQLTSVFADADYKQALSCADGPARALYEQEAKAIDALQKGILAISAQEEPYDVFLCYKETGADGKRTRDSVKVQEIYYALTQEGYRVFFSRISLESRLGEEYVLHLRGPQQRQGDACRGHEA